MKPSRLENRIVELQFALAETRREDVRETIRWAMKECEKRVVVRDQRAAREPQQRLETPQTT